MLRCASSFVIAAYAKRTPHSSGFARLACGLFTKPSPIQGFYNFFTRPIIYGRRENREKTTLGGNPPLAHHRRGRGPRAIVHFHDPAKHRPAEGADDPPPLGEGRRPDPLIRGGRPDRDRDALG